MSIEERLKNLLLTYDDCTVFCFDNIESESYFEYCQVFRLNLIDGVRLVFVPDSLLLEFKDFVNKNNLSYEIVLSI